MVKNFVVVSAIIMLLAGDVFSWSLPVKVGGGPQVDVKGLTNRTDKLMDSVLTANEKLGLALADVYTMTGKIDEAVALKNEIASQNAEQNKMLRSKKLIASLDGSFTSLNKASLRKLLESSVKSVISSTSLGSAVVNITEAVKSDKDAVAEAKPLSEDLSNAVKSATANPALATSVTDLKSALEAVALIIDSVPKQIEYATALTKELREFAQANGITIK